MKISLILQEFFYQPSVICIDKRYWINANTLSSFFKGLYLPTDLHAASEITLTEWNQHHVRNLITSYDFIQCGTLFITQVIYIIRTCDLLDFWRQKTGYQFLGIRKCNSPDKRKIRRMRSMINGFSIFVTTSCDKGTFIICPMFVTDAETPYTAHTNIQHLFTMTTASFSFMIYVSFLPLFNSCHWLILAVLEFGTRGMRLACCVPLMAEIIANCKSHPIAWWFHVGFPAEFRSCKAKGRQTDPF